MDDQDDPPKARFTLTGLTSLSETSLSPGASKLVVRAVDRAYRCVSQNQAPGETGGDGPSSIQEEEEDKTAPDVVATKSGASSVGSRKGSGSSAGGSRKGSGASAGEPPKESGGQIGDSRRESGASAGEIPKGGSGGGSAGGSPKESGAIVAGSRRESGASAGGSRKSGGASAGGSPKESEAIFGESPKESGIDVGDSQTPTGEISQRESPTSGDGAKSKKQSVDEDLGVATNSQESLKGIAEESPFGSQTSLRDSTAASPFGSEPPSQDKLRGSGSEEVPESGADLRATPSTQHFDVELQPASAAGESTSESAVIFPRVYPSESTHSTQVLVPVNLIPEESLYRVGPTESFVQSHTIPVESEMGAGGLRLHRNEGSLELDLVEPNSTIIRLEQELSRRSTLDEQAQESAPDSPGGGGEIFGAVGGLFESPPGSPGLVTSSQEFKTLIDEMASKVAEMALEGMETCESGGFFEEVYKRFAEVAKTAGTITANSRATSMGQYPGSTSAGTSGARGRLPSEIKEHILRTLSDIKTQLDKVKGQLTK